MRSSWGILENFWLWRLCISRQPLCSLQGSVLFSGSPMALAVAGISCISPGTGPGYGGGVEVGLVYARDASRRQSQSIWGIFLKNHRNGKFFLRAGEDRRVGNGLCRFQNIVSYLLYRQVVIFSSCHLLAAASYGQSFRTAHDARWSKLDGESDIQVGVIGGIKLCHVIVCYGIGDFPLCHFG